MREKKYFRLISFLILICSSSFSFAGSDDCELESQEELSFEEMNKKLLEAAKKNDKEALIKYLDMGADINTQEKSGGTALHISIAANSWLLVWELLDRKADVNVVARGPLFWKLYAFGILQGITVLHTAALLGDANLVKILLGKGAKQILTFNRMSPLDLAFFSRSYGETIKGFDYFETMKVLVEDARSKDMDPFFGQMNLLSVLNNRDPKEEFYHEKRLGDVKLFLRLLTDHEKDIQNSRGDTALHLAVREENPDLVQLLIDFMADENIKNDDGCTPLVLAEQSLDKKLTKNMLMIHNLLSDYRNPRVKLFQQSSEVKLKRK